MQRSAHCWAVVFWALGVPSLASAQEKIELRPETDSERSRDLTREGRGSSSTVDVRTVVRGGVTLFGRGVMDFDGSCSTGCPNITDGVVSTQDLPRGITGVDLLARTGMVRSGVAVWVVPEVAVRLERSVSYSGEREVALGTDVMFPFLLEGAVPVTDRVDLVLRGAIGFDLFATGGVVERDRRAIQSFCRQLGPDEDCRAGMGARVGWLLGGGPGLIVHLTPEMAFRGDLFFQRHDLRLLNAHSRAAGSDWSAEYGHSGFRSWFMLGLEVGE